VGVAPPALIPLAAASGLDASGWAEQEFGACELGLRLPQKKVRDITTAFV